MYNVSLCPFILCILERVRIYDTKLYVYIYFNLYLFVVRAWGAACLASSAEKWQKETVKEREMNMEQQQQYRMHIIFVWLFLCDCVRIYIYKFYQKCWLSWCMILGTSLLLLMKCAEFLVELESRIPMPLCVPYAMRDTVISLCIISFAQYISLTLASRCHKRK